jgi:predicted Fe-Mo cluster-binding NifX family protein
LLRYEIHVIDPISPHFGRCPCFILVDIEDGEIESVNITDNPFYTSHMPGQVPLLVQSQGADVMLAGGMGRRAVDFFHQYGIEVATGASGTVLNAIQDYLAGRLIGTEPCTESQHHHNC